MAWFSDITGALRDWRSMNARMFGKLTIIAVGMFGFGFALVPVYKKLCEVTGLNNVTQRDEGAAEFARNTQVDRSRKVVVEFDANGNAHGAWRFKPRINSVEVHPGELVTVVYELENQSNRASAGQAIPSYAPKISGQYFRKLECFCFKQQRLEAHQKREFPVVFVVDPKLPREVNTITLSYAVFEVAGPTAALKP